MSVSSPATYLLCSPLSYYEVIHKEMHALIYRPAHVKSGKRPSRLNCNNWHLYDSYNFQTYKDGQEAGKRGGKQQKKTQKRKNM